ncbi:MAG: hypothetical protein ABIA02_02625 [Candidatus Falkowbacteria bacterium]
MIKKCILCNKEKKYTIQFNSMETFMKFRIGKKLKEKFLENVNNGFVCLDCREQLIKEKEFEEEGGVKIN